MLIRALCFITMLAAPLPTLSWGFFAHKRINRLAVFTLPPEMMPFYKKHIQYLTENAVNPDMRRYSVEGEAARHYIDLDVYGDSALQVMPRYWNDAVAKYSEDTLQAYGIVPWYILSMKNFLTYAFKIGDIDKILRLSADIGHYIGDANVPLHTTENYNGQLTGQHGIHGFWESRLPELLSDDYDFYVGKAEYIEQPQMRAWEAVSAAHHAMDSVLKFEKRLSAKFPEDKKYSYEERGNITTKVYSKKYSLAYNKLLGDQVQRQMKASIKMVGDFWFTCWVDAGQPDMLAMMQKGLSEKEKKKLEEDIRNWNNRTVKSREHN
ncbi:MAG: zinc dependent phospholipase C family protein [Cyclobacteriaceae bacterium]